MSATFMRRFHMAVFVVAMAMTPVSSFTDLRRSLPYLVFISMFAIDYGALGAWQAARAEESSDDAQTIAQEVLRLLREEGAV